MRFERTGIPGVVLVRPDAHRDDRGFFLESYHEQRYRENGIDARFVQDNHSRSVRDTLRGLHAQSPNPQAKLVRCVEGRVWDVAVDVRLGSPSFGRHFAVELTADGFEQLYVPPGLLHGFCVISEVAQVEYKCSALYEPEGYVAVRWNDPELAVPWPVAEPLLSDRDAEAPLLSEVREKLLPFT